MKSFAKVFVIAFGIPLVILVFFFMYFIAYMTGSIPEGTRYVYNGFSFLTRNGEAYELRIEVPASASIRVHLRNNPVLVSRIRSSDLVNAGFESFGSNSYSNSKSGMRCSFAFFDNAGNLSRLTIPDNDELTIPFSESNSNSELRLPISIVEIEERFGKPARKEYIFPKIEWR